LPRGARTTGVDAGHWVSEQQVPRRDRSFGDAFRRGLSEGGFIEGRAVAIEYRWAGGQYDRLPALPLELTRRPVAVFVATGGTPTALAVRSVTKTIPIIFSIGGDPIEYGLVESFNRPRGNATGLAILTSGLEPKRLGLLRELMQSATRIIVLLNSKNPPAQGQCPLP
jgi:putative ABC transport system substrate-binding protein